MISERPSRRHDEDNNFDDGDTDAISLLTADHLEVKQLFANYEALLADDEGDNERADVVRQICQALRAHATIEEEVFYPAVQAATGEAEMLDDALAEHDTAEDLIDQIEAMAPSDENYEATVRMLQDTVDQHVHQEEGELFPRVQESELDLQGLGEQIAQRKEEVLAELEAGDS